MMHELPLQENGDNLEEQHFTTALTLMAEVETEQSLKNESKSKWYLPDWQETKLQCQEALSK